MMVSMLSVFADASTCKNVTFLGLKPWYYYIGLQWNSTAQTCDLKSFNVLGSNSSLPLILLAVIDDLLRIAGMVAVFFVIYAGMKYITSQGSPEETSKAQHTLTNALIGLAIAVVAIGVVSFIGSRFGSTSGSGGVKSLPHTPGADNGNIISTVLTLMFGIVGALSFLFLVIGGFRYVTSRGDPQNIAKAKSTIMYAVIGLVVAILAQAIVTFVFKWITS